MKHFYHILFVSLLSAAAVCAQNQSPASTASVSPASTRSGSGEKAKRGPVFRATKDQIVAAQNMLKSKGAYTGEASGELDADTRASLKNYQKENGLRATGTLNRATLEKMGIELTEKQKTIPAPESSYAKADGASSGSNTSRGPVFRATKDQVIEAQKLLKAGGMYTGDETGKLDDPTRDGLKKYQEANGLKVTGTLNQATLEKMGIALTEKQKTAAGSK